LRGSLVCINQLAITIGIFCVYLAGFVFEKEVTLTGDWEGNEGDVTKEFADWKWVAFVGGGIAALYCALVILFLPESPKVRTRKRSERA